MIRKNVFKLFTAALPLFFTGCGMWQLQTTNNIKGDIYENADKYAAGDFTYAAADVDAVEICWRTGSVELTESEEAALSVTESGQELDADTQMYYWLDGRTLRIQFCRSGADVRVKSEDKALTVELPKGIDLSVYNTAAGIHAEALEQNEVFVSSHSGNFDCGSLTADSADVSASSGAIRIDRMQGDTLSIDTVSGRVEVGTAVLSGPVSCTSVSGRVEFGEVDAGELDVSTTSGGVEIQTAFNCPAANFSTTSGRLRLVLPENGAKLQFVTVSGSLKTALSYENEGDLRVFGDGGSEVNVATVSGSLELK